MEKLDLACPIVSNRATALDFTAQYFPNARTQDACEQVSLDIQIPEEAPRRRPKNRGKRSVQRERVKTATR